jgi:hypothetical protein
VAEDVSLSRLFYKAHDAVICVQFGNPAGRRMLTMVQRYCGHAVFAVMETDEAAQIAVGQIVGIHHEKRSRVIANVLKSYSGHFHASGRTGAASGK